MALFTPGDLAANAASAARPDSGVITDEALGGLPAFLRKDPIVTITASFVGFAEANGLGAFASAAGKIELHDGTAWTTVKNFTAGALDGASPDSVDESGTYTHRLSGVIDLSDLKVRAWSESTTDGGGGTSSSCDMTVDITAWDVRARRRQTTILLP